MDTSSALSAAASAQSAVSRRDLRRQLLVRRRRRDDLRRRRRRLGFIGRPRRLEASADGSDGRAVRCGQVRSTAGGGDSESRLTCEASVPASRADSEQPRLVLAN